MFDLYRDLERQALDDIAFESYGTDRTAALSSDRLRAMSNDEFLHYIRELAGRRNEYRERNAEVALGRVAEFYEHWERQACPQSTATDTDRFATLLTPAALAEVEIIYLADLVTPSGDLAISDAVWADVDANLGPFGDRQV